MKVAFQGEYGAYSEQAIYKNLGRKEVLPCETLDHVFERVSRGQVSKGVVPIENSIGGSIDRAYDLLLSYDQVTITGEIYLPIRHCLLANEGSTLEDIKYVYSHPQALKQCERFLSKLGVKMRPSYDTAGSAKVVKKRNKKDEAAIAARVAAKRYGLIILSEGIESFKNNVTRFFVISKEKDEKAARKKYKTSITFEAEDTPGSLLGCLQVFAKRDINLTMLQSRPIKGTNWKYLFYLDFEGYLEDPSIENALRELKQFTISYKILGSYPKGDR